MKKLILSLFIMFLVTAAVSSQVKVRFFVANPTITGGERLVNSAQGNSSCRPNMARWLMQHQGKLDNSIKSKRSFNITRCYSAGSKQQYSQ
ncbi:MAG: hypothetical protein JNK43_02505 [Ignavibacteria bacterium]|nr:hypothetical protein [Ignavibacteria bacterium]